MAPSPRRLPDSTAPPTVHRYPHHHHACAGGSRRGRSGWSSSSSALRCFYRKLLLLSGGLFVTATLLFMQSLAVRSGGPDNLLTSAESRSRRHFLQEGQAAASANGGVVGGGGGDHDAIFKPKNLQEKGPLGHERAGLLAAAIDGVPPKHHLLEIQQDIMEHQNRPPDSAYNLNVTLSDSIPLDRKIEDTRPEVCKEAAYYNRSSGGGGGGDLPTVSVIVPFYNEALSLLLRTIHSILNRTPDRILLEILLVDDNSTHGYLQEPLEKYVSLLPKVKLLRNRQREGLIRSRMRGADVARAAVLVFLDAHTEVNVGWVEPMLAEIRKHPDTVVQPFVDGINIQTLEYSQPRKIYRGSFSWDLRYVWIKVPDHMERSIMEEGTPYWSATLVGCAIAVSKAYFYKIGAFDTDQKIWGGENIELAFRVWMCGGRVLTLPCSRVGHVFRPLPYKLDDEGWENPWQKNLMRVADVWMGDDFKRYFYSSTRIYEHRRVEYSPEERRSLEKRKELKKELQCKDFQWYLTNVAPEIPVPPRDAKMHGEVTNYRTQACWEVLPDSYLSMSYSCYEHKIITENIFTLSHEGFLTYRDRCLRFMFPKPLLKLVECPEKPSYAFGKWRLQYKDQHRWAQIKVTMEIHGRTNTWCVMQVTSAVDVHFHRQMPQVADCDEDNMFQFWAFTYRFDYKG